MAEPRIIVPDTKPVRARRRRIRWKRWVFGVPAGLLLPFPLLVGISVLLYHRWEWNGWLAIGAAALASAVLLSIPLAALARVIGMRVGKVLLKGMPVLFAAYLGYLLVFISSANVKSEDVRSTYRTLHPILRVAVSTLVLVDGDVVVTDAGRSMEDYAAMGLPAPQSSLHFAQGNGHVYAVDIRTRGRSSIRNKLTSLWFMCTGFDVLRHVGTADHLHVSLRPR